jgi:hypothetical protein
MMRFGSPRLQPQNGLIRPAGEPSVFDGFAIFRLPDRATTGFASTDLASTDLVSTGCGTPSLK